MWKEHDGIDEKHTIADLRECGFVVVIFGPTELKGVDPDLIESELVHVGNEMIHNLAVEND